MGTVNSECIIATTWDKKAIEKMEKWITTLSEEDQSLFVIIPTKSNNNRTLFLAPEGSLKGWAEAIQGDLLRRTLIKRLKSFNDEEGGNPFDWVEVGYGDYGQKILHGNCKNMFNDKDYAIEIDSQEDDKNPARFKWE